MELSREAEGMSRIVKERAAARVGTAKIVSTAVRSDSKDSPVDGGVFFILIL